MRIINRIVSSCAVVCIAAAIAFSQTQIDLRTQGKRPDFAASKATRPAQTGATLPETCGEGELFFKTGATAGQNLYGCTSSNTWKILGDYRDPVFEDESTPLTPRYTFNFAGSAIECTDDPTNSRINCTVPGSAAVRHELQVVRSSATQLTIQPNCSANAPCNLAWGNTTAQFTAPCTVTITGGTETGTARIYYKADGTIYAGHDITAANIAVSGPGCAAVASVSAFPPDSFIGYQWPITSGNFDAAVATFDKRPFLSMKGLTGGHGVVVSETNGTATVAVDTAVIGTFVSGTATPSGSCTVGQKYLDTDDNKSYECTSTNTWTETSGGGSSSGGYATVQDEATGLTQRATINFTGSGVTCADDSVNSRTNCAISGTATGLADPGSNGIVARTASNTTTARTITGTTNEVAITNGDGVSGNPTVALASDVDLSGKTTTKPVKTGTSLPSTCAVGELFYDTDATAGQNLYGCTATDTWTLQGDGGGGSGAPTDAQYIALATNSTLTAERVLTPRDNLTATDGGAGSTYTVDFNPLDRSVFWLVDDFFGGTTTSGNVGDLGWNPVYGGSPTINSPGAAGDANHPSVLELTSGTTSGNGVEIYWGGAATAKNWVAWNTHPWELQWIFKTGSSITSAFYSVGLGVYPSDGFSSSEGVRLRYSTVASDPAWVFAQAQGTTNWTTACTASEAPIADTWYRTQWVSDGSTIYVHLYKDGGTADLFTSCSTSTYSTSIGVAPYIGVATAEAAAKSIYVDWFAFKMRGLSR
ncbi:MAG: hypothetical protein ABFD60_12210 [Bryobacteraceae bacterium]